MQAREKGLNQSRQHAKRKDLTAMGMSRDLKVDPLLASLGELYRLMRKQDDGLRIIPTIERSPDVGSVTVSKLVRRPVVDAGQLDGFAVLLEIDSLVPKGSDAEST